MLGTAFMAGIGAAADTARATLENIPAKLEDDLKEMGVLYNAQNEKFNKSMAAAEANIANIERIASDFGMEAGIVPSSNPSRIIVSSAPWRASPVSSLLKEPCNLPSISIDIGISPSLTALFGSNFFISSNILPVIPAPIAP